MTILSLIRPTWLYIRIAGGIEKGIETSIEYHISNWAKKSFHIQEKKEK